MSVKKNLSLTDRQQLVDLNEDTVNFNLNFTVVSKDKVPFYLIVVDQNTLDKDDPLEFKHCDKGVISGNIISDKDVYQNYYLCLKADNPCDVQVIIDKKEISPNTEQPIGNDPNGGQYKQTQPNQPSQHTQPQNYTQPLQQNQDSQVGQAGQAGQLGQVNKHNQGQNNWKMMLLVLGLLGSGALVYYFYVKKSQGESLNQIRQPAQPTEINQPAVMNRSYSDSSSTSESYGGKRMNSSLLAKLNALP